MKSSIEKTSDNKLIKQLQANPSSSTIVNELTRRHSGIFIKMVTSYTSDSLISVRDELICEKSYHIYHCALKYKPSRGAKFSTFIGNETKWMCLNIYNKHKKRPTISVEEIVHDLSQEFSDSVLDKKNLDKEVFSYIIKIVKDYSDPRIYKIFKKRYIEGHKNKVMPWKKVSKDLGMSIQGCINIHDSTINKIKNKLKEI